MALFLWKVSQSNKIDYILTPKRYKSSINKAQTRTYPGADIGSDHDLVMTTLRLKLKANKKNKSPRIRFNLDKLKDPTVAEAFQATLGGKFAALDFVHDDIQNVQENFNAAIIETSEEILGRERVKKQKWMNDDILDLCDKRRAMKPIRNENDANRKEYREINNEIKSRKLEAKEKWIEEKCTKIERDMTKGNSKSAYATIKELTKVEQPRTTVVEDKEGKLLTESTAVLGRWTQYCHELYNHELKVDDTIIKDSTKERETNSENNQVLQEEVGGSLAQSVERRT